jgi:hypothetical protein
MVDVEHDPRRAALAAAVAAAEAVAGEDPEAELGGERIADTPDRMSCQGVSRT